MEHEFEFCLLEKRDHIWVVTINRPEAMNSLHPAANFELETIFNDFSEDEKDAILDSVETLGYEDGKNYREQEFSEKTLKLEFFDKSFKARKFRRKLSKELKKLNISFVTQECISSRCVFKKK